MYKYIVCFSKECTKFKNMQVSNIDTHLLKKVYGTRVTPYVRRKRFGGSHLLRVYLFSTTKNYRLIQRSSS